LASIEYIDPLFPQKNDCLLESIYQDQDQCWRIPKQEIQGRIKVLAAQDAIRPMGPYLPFLSNRHFPTCVHLSFEKIEILNAQSETFFNFWLN